MSPNTLSPRAAESSSNSHKSKSRSRSPRSPSKDNFSNRMSQKATFNSESSDREEDNEIIMMLDEKEMEPEQHIEKLQTLHKAKS